MVWLTSCATSVNVDYDPATNFSGLKTFQVQAKPEAIPEDPRVNSPFMQQRVTAAITEQLKLKNMLPAKASPDTVVKYHLGIRQEMQSNDSGVSVGVGTASRHTAVGFMFGFPVTDVATIDNLVITLDMVNVKTGNLLWRGPYQA